MKEWAVPICEVIGLGFICSVILSNCYFDYKIKQDVLNCLQKSVTPDVAKLCKDKS